MVIGLTGPRIWARACGAGHALGTAAPKTLVIAAPKSTAADEIQLCLAGKGMDIVIAVPLTPTAPEDLDPPFF